MFFSNFFQRKQPRAFGFTPFYYEVNEDSVDGDEHRRIQFTRLRRRTLSSKNSVRVKILFAIFLVIFLYYFQGLLEADKRDLRIEEVKIEELPEL